MKKGDKAGSLADFDQAIALDPNNDAIYLARSYVYESSGELAKAVDDLTETLAKKPDEVEQIRRCYRRFR